MKKEIKKLTVESFSKFGTYANMINPVAEKFGEEPIEFYRDMLQQSLGMTAGNTVSYSLCRLLKREYVIEASEYHNYSSEMIIPLDGDILMHVASATASDDVPVKDIEIYHIPKGTMVCIRPGVWHQAAFAYNCDCVNILVALPERTYAADCHLIPLKPEDYIEISVEN